MRSTPIEIEPFLQEFQVFLKKKKSPWVMTLCLKSTPVFD